MYQAKYIQLKDSVYNEDFTNNLMRVQAESLERENKIRIASQDQILKLKDKVIGRQKWLNVMACTVAGLLILVVYSLYVSNNQRKRSNQLLDQKVVAHTRELELSYEELRRRLEEEDIAMEKTLIGVKSDVATLKGLSSLSMKGEDTGTVDQIKLLNVKINRLSEILTRV